MKSFILISNELKKLLSPELNEFRTDQAKLEKKMAVDFPAFGQLRASNELREEGIFVFCSGGRFRYAPSFPLLKRGLKPFILFYVDEISI